MAKDIFDAVYGSLIGGAIGDALGAPVEGWYWHEIREKYRDNGGRITELEPGTRGNTGLSYGDKTLETPPGQFTDDTTLRHYQCLAIVRKGGRITPNDFASVLLEKLNKNRLWVNDHLMYDKLRIGMNPWDTGKGNPPAGCATMAIAPIGIINAGDPAQAYQDAFNIAFVNQDNENRDGAATFAAGVAAAFLPGATAQSVVEAMLEYSAFEVKRALLLTLDLAYASDSIDEFAQEYYATMLDYTWPSPPDRPWNKHHYFSGSSLEMVPITAAMLYFCPDDPNQAIIEAASFGRDCDSTASMVGNIAGVLHGATTLRQDWVETVESANSDFFIEVDGDPNLNFRAMAERMIKALKREKENIAQRLVSLEAMLSG